MASNHTVPSRKRICGKVLVFRLKVNMRYGSKQSKQFQSLVVNSAKWRNDTERI